MKWSERAWQASQEVNQAIFSMPFITELMQGTLAKEKFVQYIQQDALYLARYGKVLAALAVKLDKVEHTEAFLGFAKDTMMVEKILHESYVGELKDLSELKASPGCMLYTNYLERQIAHAPLEVALAAVLPCFWIYKEVGDYILENQTTSDNPYQDWINTYGGEEFGSAVKKAISICDEIAEQTTGQRQEEMTAAFVMCSKLEWIFWDSAYRLEKWPI
ncbi:TenA family protein [Myroides albus]|uniref:Thiaminase II n=1 Tax=Myroides albus TaxID=2562892 RepID=A0A6I3LJI1_9FLAO|nr:TenA family protein [Myroides albus]MTG98738.1 thiaminase II [Myroides albus]UVD79063.1 TenA family protein [Myroides albus]